MRPLALLGLIVATALPSGCDSSADNKAIEAIIIGATLEPATGTTLTPPAALVADATTIGLVRLDRDGQVIPGVAARWAILDDGLDYIFRIDDDSGLKAREIARRLRTAIRARKHSPEHALTDTIDSIEAVTGTVIELRLSTPQPDLLTVLARPDYGIGVPGTMRAQARGANSSLLRPAPGAEPPRPWPVLLRAESAGIAVARFTKGDADLVLGGTFDDLPVVHAASPKRATLRFDPAVGLFGLALHDTAGPAVAPALRHALSLAIDRDRIVAAIGATGLAKATTLAGSTIEPPLADRRAEAARLIADAHPAIKVAIPNGPGGQALFKLLAEDWSSVGIIATPAAMDAPADLLLVDLVTPAGSRNALACAISAGCDPKDRLALIDPPYIPIAAPVRWSLVAGRLDRFVENEVAAHPLDRLRSP